MKKSTGVWGFFLLSVLWLTAAEARGQAWHQFTSGEGNFSVSVPGEPTPGQGDSWTVELKDGNGIKEYGYLFRYRDLIDGIGETKASVFEWEGNQIQYDYNLPEMSRKVFTYHGYPCCEFDFVRTIGPGAWSRIIRRVVLAGRRVYTVQFEKMVLDFESKGTPAALGAKSFPDEDKFFNSLVLMKPDEDPDTSL